MSDPKPTKPGRNAPCPCGSGLKYKKCHGATNEQRPDASGSKPTQLGLNQLIHQAQGLVRLNRLEEAERWLQAAIQHYPGSRDAWFQYAQLADRAGDLETAAQCYQKATEIEPRDALALFFLGNAYLRLHAVDKAAQAYEQAVAVKPDLQGAWQNLGNVEKYNGHYGKAIAHYLRAIELEQDEGERARRHSSLLNSLHYSRDFSTQELFSEHQVWAQTYAAKHYPETLATIQTTSNREKLRIGYLSGNFNGDIIFYFLYGVLRHHDLDRFEVYCYSSTKVKDEKTKQLKEHCAVWREIGTLDDAAAASLIRQDEVDILVDLDGHSPNGRPLILARRAAPVQIEWLDWFNTTGMKAVDYVISDLHTTPLESSQRFVEEVARLPHSRVCYSPPSYAPPVDEQSTGSLAINGQSIEERGITFGSFNRHDKIGPEVIACWAELLSEVPGSRLLLKNRGLQAPALRDALRAAFAAHGVSDERLDLRGPSPHAEMLRDYAEVDIALDTFPYNGGLTSCEALWMGVPIIAIEGERMLERQTAAFLRVLEMDAWIAQDRAGYVTLGQAWARQAAQIRQGRAELRERMRASPLCQCEQFTRDLERLYRDVTGSPPA